MIIFSITLIYGVVIELLQHYCTIKRTGDVWDLVADGAGALITLSIFRFLKPTR